MEPSKKLARSERLQSVAFISVAIASLILAITVAFLIRTITERRQLNDCQFQVTVITGRGLASLAHGDRKGVIRAGDELEQLVGTNRIPKECNA